MAMFRVSIRRATTKAPLWDWMQTVSSKTSGDALNSAYQSWVDSNPNPAAPPLSQCESSVKPVAMTATAHALAAMPPAQAAFIQQLQSEVAQALSTQLNGNFELVNAPQGFNYGITYGSNAYYNPATCAALDSLLTVSTNGNLALTGQSFSTLYAQVLQAVAFQFSQADQAMMNKQDAAASAQIASILTEFTDANGTFSNPLPLGGQLQDVFNQLNKTYGDISKLPSTLNALRNAIASYQAMAGASYALHNRYYLATARLQAAQANVTTPGAANGGMQVDLSRYTSSGSSVNMSFNYPGITLVPATPSPLSLDNSTGWLDQEILNEVVANTGKDATGYALQGSAFSVADVFGVGKALSRLKTFVICQAPTITFGPPVVSGTIPLQQQAAYVLGGVPSYPPVQV